MTSLPPDPWPNGDVNPESPVATASRAIAAAGRLWLARLTEAAGGTICRRDGVLWVHDSGDSGESTIAYPDFSGADGPALLDAILEDYRGRRPRPTVLCHTGHTPRLSVHGVVLHSRGFRPPGEFTGMVLRPQQFADPGDSPEGVSLAPQREVGLWQQFEHPYLGRANPNWPARAVARDAAWQRWPDRLTHWLAWRDSRPVGHATVSLANQPGGPAGIFDVGVLPAERKRGIGRAVTAAACRWALERGAGCLVLVASPMGHPVYRRLGFEEVGPDRLFALPADRLTNPPTPRQQAIALAAGRSDLDALARLFSPDQRDDIDTALPCNLRPLALAARAGQAAAVEWLLAHGAQPDVPSMVLLGWRERLPELLQAFPEMINRFDEYGSTPLHKAAWDGDAALVALLLTHGADAAVEDSAHRSTPLGWAEHNQKHDVAALLREHGAR